jgi:hypothetical protein
VVIGGYESGMDAAVHLANAGIKATVMASTPFWSIRTLDPSTELAPFTKWRLQVAQAGENPPTLMSHCRVVSVEKEASGSGYVVIAERTTPTANDDVDKEDDDGGKEDETAAQHTVLVGRACRSGGVQEKATNDDSSASGSDSDSDSDSQSEDVSPVVMDVDQYGRVVAQLAAKHYRFRSFSKVFSEKTAPSMQVDCCAAAHSIQSTEHSEGQTFWIGAGDAPRCSLEHVALDIFRFHTDVEGCSFDANCSGAEWRALAVGAKSSYAAWHWDKDYALEQDGFNFSPHLGTVTYLSDGGAPTLIADKTCATDYSADISGQGHAALLSRPHYGKHIVFDGRYLHAAPSELSLWDGDDGDSDNEEEAGQAMRVEQAQQVILLVNIWLNWKPRDAVHCPDTIIRELGTTTVPLNFEHELNPIPAVLTASGGSSEGTEDSMDTIEWQFETAKQMAVMSFTASLNSIREMGTKSGASLLLRSWLEPKAKRISTPTTEGTTAEIVRVRTPTKPVLATGFHSGVAKTVNHLFEWTTESLCDTSISTSGGDVHTKPQLEASASEAHNQGEMAMPAGDAKLTKCDESTIYPGVFLCGPQVRQDDQILCFVYKYRQRFAVVMNEIATRLGLETEQVVAECRQRHMFLEDMSNCEATCGSTCKQPAATAMESNCPLVRIDAKVLPKKLKKPIVEDLRTRGRLVSKAQDALADAIASGDLDKMAELLDVGLAQVQRTSLVTLDTAVEGESETHCFTPLHVAAEAGGIEAAKFLLERGADPAFTAYTGKSLTPLMLAACSCDDADLVSLLIDQGGADVDAVSPNGATALHFACDVGFSECAVALIRAGCDRSAKDAAGMTAQQVRWAAPR